MISGFAYLASPYSHPEFAVRVQRFLAARDYCIVAFKDKVPIYSPIVHWHPIQVAEGEDFPFDFASFQTQNDAFIHACSSFVVLAIDGWKESRGIRHELDLAVHLGKSMNFIYPEQGGIRTHPIPNNYSTKKIYEVMDKWPR